MNKFSSLIFPFLGVTVFFFFLFFLFSKLQKRGSQADPEAYEKLISGSLALGSLSFLCFIILSVVVIFNLIFN